jgi:uncharacterized protein (DUF488 family)
MRPKAICTIGYEGGTIDAFLRALREAGVELVLDIRAAPVSRKKGFSKNQLAAHLAEAGIGYRHLRGLGTPKRGRDAARGGDIESFERIFLQHMEEPEAPSISARQSRWRKASRSACFASSATRSTVTA